MTRIHFSAKSLPVRWETIFRFLTSGIHVVELPENWLRWDFLMNVIDTKLNGVKVIEPEVFGDDRGFFFESWNETRFRNAGLDISFNQDNHSRSNRGVLRGLHFQNPGPQGKLVRVVAGAVFDVAVDLRQSSATYGAWFGIELSASNHRMLWIPEGFAHGFLTLVDGTDFLYKCRGAYDPATENSLAWNDPDVGIDWPLDGICPILSPKDKDAMPLGRVQSFA